jgi:hypothetical protein
MTRMLRVLVACAAMAALRGVEPAWGQNLSLSTAVIAFPTAGVQQLDQGAVEHPGISVDVDAGSAGTAWTLKIRSLDAVLGAEGKPLRDLEWRTEGSSAWTPLGTADETVASGAGNATVTLHFRTRLHWASDGPGAFGASLIFTLEAS